MLEKKKDCYLMLRYILTTQRSYLKFLKGKDLPHASNYKPQNAGQNANPNAYGVRGNF